MGIVVLRELGQRWCDVVNMFGAQLRESQGARGTEYEVGEARRQRCEALINAVPIPDPFNVRQFLVDLSVQRGKPITLMTDTVPSSSLCGLLISTPEADYIYCADQSGLLAEHTVIHEVGHILFGHGALVGDGHDESMQLLQELLPHLPPHLIRRILARSMYDSEQEKEAELFARLMCARIHSPHTHTLAA